jgi:arsenate reductase-like glutaredoxin family protein
VIDLSELFKNCEPPTGSVEGALPDSTELENYEPSTGSVDQAQNVDPIQEAVEFIRQRIQDRDRGNLEIGTYLLENFFENDITKAFSKDPKKINSYRRLCEREDLGIDISTLSRMLRVAAQEKYLRDQGIDPSALSFTHKAELVKLRNDEAKLSFVREILPSPPSSRQLAQRVKQMNDGAQTASSLSTTKRRLSSLRKTLGKPEIAQLLGNHDQTLLSDESIMNIISDLREKSSCLVALCDDFFTAAERHLAE